MTPLTLDTRGGAHVNHLGERVQSFRSHQMQGSLRHCCEGNAAAARVFKHHSSLSYRLRVHVGGFVLGRSTRERTGRFRFS